MNSATPGARARLLIVPGLHDSGPAHWQSWLQAQVRDARRVEQRDWSRPELDRWAERIASTLDRERDAQWIAVAHSFGCLALARHLLLRADTPVRAALFVAPAEPDKFGVAAALPASRLAIPSTVIASDNDPWMSAASTRRWAQRWGSGWMTLGDAGHVNAESGFGPLPVAKRWVTTMQQRLTRARRAEQAGDAWSLAA
ncbi:MAG TPA: alpha/beta hydrolase [Methylibium sp.]|uniref:RBBP9/YdeN family alpha/beta hydrolase n=1 Tax=Methylibium sp. TaxID=2067992 RepID=UPI002DBCBCD7|nr:alpha/beta hydrolase [Methylibium sp.]HEU4458282.1 alpha/beta hydrolase [Methylibium sp.]